MSNEVKEILPGLIDTLKTLSQSDEYSHFKVSINPGRISFISLLIS